MLVVHCPLRGPERPKRQVRHQGNPHHHQASHRAMSSPALLSLLVQGSVRGLIRHRKEYQRQL